MAKKQTKITKEETLETILFNCRNSLRGRAAMTDKRDLLLTLVFLKFIGERFKQQKEKIRHEIIEVQGIHELWKSKAFTTRLLLNCNCSVPISICRMVYFSLRMKHFGTS